MAKVKRTVYAKSQGITRQALSKRIKKRGLPVDPDGQIDTKKAEAWEKKYHQAHHGGPRSTKKELPNPIQSRPLPPEVDTHEPLNLSDDAGIQEAMRVERIYKARQEKVKYEREIGTLLLAKDVEVQVFETYRNVRDGLLNIPNRVAGQVASILGLEGIEGQEQMFQILNKEIYDVLEELSSSVNKQ